MAIFEVCQDAIKPIEPTSFGAAQLKERSDLQRLLRDQIDVVAREVLVISEEFGDWEESRRRIDLLAVDKDGNLVVIELKRTADGGHMDLQAVRYAAMLSTLTASKAVEIFGQYLQDRDREGDPEKMLLDFLEWDEIDEDKFAQDVRIVLVAADFSRELTTAVMWLNEKDLDIRCVRIRPYSQDGHVLIDVQQVVPLPEAADYQIQVREKKRQERKARKTNPDFTRYDLTIEGVLHRAQWKRNAILLVVKHLCAGGTTPDRIAEILAPARKSRVWRIVSHETEDIEEFRSLAAREAEASGRRYDDRRWHTREGDLFNHNGSTYALSNQWGRSWDAAMKILRQQCPESKLIWVSARGGTDHAT